ncbi:glycoside hydrolase [Micromonospora sp. DR5-3]|uniref:exo-alpha-sialidase n=1 Tax=Micromonospora sp. DR5-3 TaxID=2992129 RepID=UPI0022327C88|nr:sialidase family protein [Micromonospora sp. DR5-3]MCW3818893.1 glycoside hydrolase [Micromonospora sp. DR5-3]
MTQAAGYDTVVDGRTEKKIFVSTGSNPDVGTADSVNNVSVSVDSGKSFLTTKPDRPEMALNFGRLQDGILIAIDFIPEWADDSHTAVNIITRHSHDGGESWQIRKGLFRPPAGEEFGGMNRGLRVHRRPIVLLDGTIMVPAYTSYKSDKGRGASVILESKDGGESWIQRSRIPASLTTNEVGWSYGTDGRLVAALRTGEVPPRLVTSYSDDDGRTWSPATPLRGPDGNQIVGIDPDIVLQPNGIMVLATGRPDDRILIDYDGTGQTWDAEEVVFANAPSTTNNGRYDGSSANNSLVNVGANRTIFFGDKCHVWGCGAYDNQFGVFAKYLSIVTPGVGKLDLATQVRSGVGGVSGDFAKPDKRFPETRPEGAFDGSSAPHSAAVLSARDGVAPTMVVKLDQPYPVSRIGLMLGTGQPLDATVSLSADGHTWSDPVVTARGTHDHALRYTDFSAIDAQYIKITASAGTATPVTELEVYTADVQTFENEPVFGVPRGFTDAKHAWTTDVSETPGTTALGGFRSRTALRLWDKWEDDNATATKMSADTAHQTVSFDWGVTDHRGPFVVEVKGHSGGSTTTPWRFRIVDTKPAQTIEVHDGTKWTALGTLTKRVELFQWATVTIDATTTEAAITVNGQRLTTTKRAEAAASLAGIAFSTGDPIAYGPTFYIDNLRVAGA